MSIVEWETYDWMAMQCGKALHPHSLPSSEPFWMLQTDEATKLFKNATHISSYAMSLELQRCIYIILLLKWKGFFVEKGRLETRQVFLPTRKVFS